MTTEDYWNKYINGDILKIFDITCDFFSKELPEEFIENYDVSEVILETRGSHETAKEFDKVIQFSELIKKKQPKLYGKYFQYFDDFLIDYYCFHNEHSNIEKSFSNFINNPTFDFDQYLISFKKLLFYDHIDLLYVAINRNFKEINTSNQLMGNAAYDLALSRFYITLEGFHQRNHKSIFDRKMFLKLLDGYGFDFDEKFLSAVDVGLQENISKEKMLSAFQNDRNNFVITLEMYFLKYMQERNFSFALSGRLWDKVLEFWEENNNKKKCKPDDYFYVNTNELEKHLSNLSGDMFIDNKSEMIAVLWGSVYIYDFLKFAEIISQKTFDNFMETSKVLKGKVIGQYTSTLWSSNFVHLWKKPDSISTTEFIEEEKIFKKSIQLKHQKFTRLRSEITEELANIGSFSAYIIEGGKSTKNKSNSPFLDSFFESMSDEKQENTRIIEPVRTEKKIGRNEPCPCGSGKKYKKCCGKL